MPRQDAWVMPIMICKMMFLTAAQNRCIKSMPKMAHAPDSKIRTREEQFLETRVSSIRLVVSAAIIAPPNACDGDLNC